MSKVDICVLTAGRFDLLKQCLDAIYIEMENTSYNLYVLDNGSKIEELQMFHSLLVNPKITRTKRLNKNKGYPIGANTVINMGNSPLVLFVSDDVILQPGTLKSLIDTMNNDQKIGICGLKLLFPKYSSDPQRPAGKVQHVGHAFNLHGMIIHPFMGWSSVNPKTCVSQVVSSVTGAAFMVRRVVFNRVGGFSDVYGTGYMEDVEMCLKIHKLGHTVWVDTNAIAEHHVGATFIKLNEGTTLEQNKRIFFDRNKELISWSDWTLR